LSQAGDAPPEPATGLEGVAEGRELAPVGEGDEAGACSSSYRGAIVCRAALDAED
jgi:hypothetical protein